MLADLLWQTCSLWTLAWLESAWVRQSFVRWGNYEKTKGRGKFVPHMHSVRKRKNLFVSHAAFGGISGISRCFISRRWLRCSHHLKVPDLYSA